MLLPTAECLSKTGRNTRSLTLALLFRHMAPPHDLFEVRRQVVLMYSGTCLPCTWFCFPVHTSGPLTLHTLLQTALTGRSVVALAVVLVAWDSYNAAGSPLSDPRRRILT